MLAELRRPATAGRGWGNLALLVVSLALFVSLGFINWTLDQMLLLLLVLFIHECGHYAAMRAFNYRNVKLFFIPLFGAAVSGRPQDAPGHKRVVVALMGPVPGIVIGLGLAVAFRFVQDPFLKHAAWLFLFLNAFNLLPLVPFDGGHVLNEVIFSRNRWVEAIFKAMAGFVLILLGFMIHAVLIGILGFFMLVTAPAAFKLGTVVQWWRGRGPASLPANADDLTAEQCQCLLRVVKSEFPGCHKYPQLAGIVRAALDRANARPPSVVASICLLGAYGAAFFVALVGAVLLSAP